MKKSASALLALVMVLSLFSAFGQHAAAAAGGPAQAASDLVTVMVNIKGWGGHIEATDDGTDPVPDPDFPSQSAYINTEKGTVIKILAEPDEGFHFLRWIVNGTEYSTDPLITVTAEEDVEYLAQFLPEGKDGKPVDLDKVKVLGDLLGLPDLGYGFSGETYVYAFEQDDNTYRAICDIPEEVSQALFDLDFDDPDYSKKQNELISPLPVRAIENLTEGIPSQEEVEQYIGKTGQELIDAGWSVYFYNLENLEFGMNGGVYSYAITFTGEVPDAENFDEYTDMGGLTVSAITCDGIGDPTWIEMPE